MVHQNYFQDVGLKTMIHKNEIVWFSSMKCGVFWHDAPQKHMTRQHSVVPDDRTRKACGRAGFKYVFSNTNTNTNTSFQIFQIQIQIQIRWKNLFKYKYKYKYKHSNTNTNTNMLKKFIQIQIKIFKYKYVVKILFKYKYKNSNTNMIFHTKHQYQDQS